MRPAFAGAPKAHGPCNSYRERQESIVRKCLARGAEIGKGVAPPLLRFLNLPLLLTTGDRGAAPNLRGRGIPAGVIDRPARGGIIAGV